MARASCGGVRKAACRHPDQTRALGVHAAPETVGAILFGTRAVGPVAGDVQDRRKAGLELSVGARGAMAIPPSGAPLRRDHPRSRRPACARRHPSRRQQRTGAALLQTLSAARPETTGPQRPRVTRQRPDRLGTSSLATVSATPSGARPGPGQTQHQLLGRMAAVEHVGDRHVRDHDGPGRPQLCPLLAALPPDLPAPLPRPAGVSSGLPTRRREAIPSAPTTAPGSRSRRCPSRRLSPSLFQRCRSSGASCARIPLPRHFQRHHDLKRHVGLVVMGQRPLSVE